MGTEDPSVPLRAQSADAADACDETPTRHALPPAAASQPSRFGVVHETSRHSCCFTVVGNHLAQHPELSLLAIGLGVHIQSLPAGSRIDIKTLAARFPEGRTTIAAGLRELETHHYLRRKTERVAKGRIITRTFFRNRPAPCRHQTQRALRGGRTGDEGLPVSGPMQEAKAAQHCEKAKEPRLREPEPEPVAEPPVEQKPEPTRGQAPESAPEQRQLAPRKKRALPVVPKPLHPTPALLQQAGHILTGLQHRDHRLVLSATDTAHLAPAVATWLERDTTPAAITHALTAGIPTDKPVRYPAAFLAYRLIIQLPAPRPFHKPAPEPPAPMRTCDHCGRAYRSRQPDTCPCRTRPRPAAPSGSETLPGDYSAQNPPSAAAERVRLRAERLAHEAQQRAAAATN